MTFVDSFAVPLPVRVITTIMGFPLEDIPRLKRWSEAWVAPFSGQLGPEEAEALKEAGVTAYNHNIDTSPEFYPEIVTTHTFDDRLQTIRNVQDAGMSVCCGGILGLGETTEDRLKMIEVISSLMMAMMRSRLARISSRSAI